jgi:hypothetical protein
MAAVKLFFITTFIENRDFLIKKEARAIKTLLKIFFWKKKRPFL